MGMALQRNRITSDLASKGMSLYTAQSATGVWLWPSADGGLQIFMSLPLFGGNPAEGLQSHPNVFIHVAWDSSIRISLPYVLLEESGAAHIAYIVANELDLQLDRIHVEGSLNRQRLDTATTPSVSDFDIENAAGDQFRAAATLLHEMLVAAAAQIWDVKKGECRAWNGLVIHTPTRRHLHYGALSRDAMMQLP